jgi:hypothetical protein
VIGKAKTKAKLTADERGLAQIKGRMNLGTETNYNKGFRLTRQDYLRLCPMGEAASRQRTGWKIEKHG